MFPLCCWPWCQLPQLVASPAQEVAVAGAEVFLPRARVRN